MSIGFKYKSEESIFAEVQKNGVWYLKYPLLEQSGCVKHGFSTRLGGVSEGYFGTMNLSFTRGDEAPRVRENINRMTKAIGVKPEDLVFSKQTHTTNVRIVTGEDRGKGVVKPLDFEDVDGMITDVPGICLATFYADCVPLFFVDPVHRAIGLSHSGWRGTVGKIGRITIENMTQVYGSNPRDIIAAVGPSICQDCYEVSEDVIEEVRANYSRSYWEQLFYQKENGRYQLDLWKANEIVLEEAGILREHMAVTNLCTCCNSELLYSHRASAGKRGNLGAFLALKER